MATPSSPAGSESRARYWLRVLRPLKWWSLLVLVLFCLRTHERLMERTMLRFTLALDGRTDYGNIGATLDGKKIENLGHVALGRHRFEVTHPNGVTFATNLFIWYGGHDFGAVNLPRAKGTLIVRADPPVPRLTIHGPEFRLTLTNSAGATNYVPTDEYLVEAQYRYWSSSQRTRVIEDQQSSVVIAPRFGALRLSCNQVDSSYQLVRGNGEMVESGEFPVTLTGLPAGKYNLIAWHHRRRWDTKSEVVAGGTNQVEVEFKYGVVAFETKPSGASVTTGDGQYLGTTPLQLAEVQPGQWSFVLKLENYEPLTTSLNITAYSTNTIRTNLTSLSYTGAMRSARKFMDGANYDPAIESLGDALRAKPDDPMATALLREASGLRSIKQAELLGGQGDYIGAGLELQKAITYLPENQRAKQLAATYISLEPEQRERRRIARLGQGRTCFDSVLKRYSDAALFDGYELKTTKPVIEVRRAIVEAMRGQTAFQYTADVWPTRETFQLEASQEFQTVLATSSGRRNVVIVGAQVKDDETQIFYKVMEFKTEAQIKFSIGNLIGAPVAVNYVPLHSSRVPNMTDKNRLQLTEGISNITARIQGVLGQTPPPEPKVVK